MMSTIILANANEVNLNLRAGGLALLIMHGTTRETHTIHIADISLVSLVQNGIITAID